MTNQLLIATTALLTTASFLMLTTKLNYKSLVVMFSAIVFGIFISNTIDTYKKSSIVKKDIVTTIDAADYDGFAYESCLTEMFVCKMNTLDFLSGLMGYSFTNIGSVNNVSKNTIINKNTRYTHTKSRGSPFIINTS